MVHTSKYLAASLALALAVAGGAVAQDQQDFGDAMRQFLAHSANGTCEDIPQEMWNTTMRNGTNQDCEGWWQSIAGDARSVADDIGQAFENGAPLLVNGTEKICVNSMPLDDYSQIVQSACWPSGMEEEPEENHAVRIRLGLPLQCVDAADYDDSTDWSDVPLQAYMVSGEVALCGDDAGEDQRSYVGLALGDTIVAGDNQTEDYDDDDDEIEDHDGDVDGEESQHADFGDMMKQYAKDAASETCEPVPQELWNTTVRDGEDQDCKGWWQSIAGGARSVADDIGQAFVGGVPLLMEDGTVADCVTSLDWDYDFSQNVKSACWPSGMEEMPEGNHAVRVTLELPLKCADVNGPTMALADIPEETIVISGEVAFCGEDAGEDQRSYRWAAGDQ
ncbi:hypothetical protein A3770_06p44220 [Chloropicon primus]|uniref:Uncharacterized protein n=1 Tax=Chloropicon primus TaxID=1764295 RepID=A0A5B8MPD1_9CHLO|nr:hypothetical protein A3770_06p44220 [Chloropicon primus]|eukprot:QDZ21904.1 hypothetical protein A3770_06p44220 [Chloropicon primus]